MKKLIYIFAAIAVFAACSEDDESRLQMPQSSAKGTFTDPRDGYEYRWVRYGNLDWMVDNAHYIIDNDAYCIIYSPSAGEGSTDWNDRTYWSKWGCLYTIEGANMACPDGWRIPTDAEWQQLEQEFGMSATDAATYGWRGNIAQNLLTDTSDSTAIHLQLGGYYAKTWVNTSSHMREWSTMGYYWTSTIDETKDNPLYFYRKLMWNKSEVYRQSTAGDDLMFSVRYVRDAE